MSLDESSKKALRLGEAMAGTVEWAFMVGCSRVAAEVGIDAFVLMTVHDGKTVVMNSAAEGGDPAADNYAKRWADMLNGMLAHPQIAGPGEIGEIRKADTTKPCCWEVVLELSVDPGVVTVLVDEFAAIDELIDCGHVGWGEIQMVDAHLVNDERAGRLPPVREQFEAALRERHR